MPVSSQGASVEFAGVTLAEVYDYAVDASVGFTKDPGEYGFIVVRSFAKAQLPFGQREILTISHGPTVVFQAVAIPDKINVEAQANNVVRFAYTFRVLSPQRNF